MRFAVIRCGARRRRAYFALAFAAVFFSGLLGGKEWYGVFDFTTLNGAFGKVVSKASLDDGTLTTASSAFRGTGWLPEPCQSCERRDIDFGGCRCQAMALLGDPAATDPVCRRSPHRGMLDALIAEETAAPPPEFHYRTPPA